MKLIACGDSWCWGAELVDPIEEPVPIMKLPGGAYDRQFKPINIEYREKHRYIGLISQHYNIKEVIDLSIPGISNDTIYRKLLDYLLENDYLQGRDTSDLFVTIGWTSPERREFFYEKQWGGDNYAMFGPWSMDQQYDNPDLSTFFNLYYKYFNHEVEFMRRYIVTIYNTELLLKKFKIRYVMHQAFYHQVHKLLQEWDDKQFTRNTLDKLAVADKKMFDLIDPIRFVNKYDEEGTAHHTIIKLAKDRNKGFEVWHPNAYGHKLWAEYLINYIDKNNLLSWTQ
jgi:hypothetical protein